MIEAERAVLGCLMLENRLALSSGLTADDFSTLDHREAFTEMVKMAYEGRPFDPVNFPEMAGCINAVGALSNFKAYADKVRESSDCRKAESLVKMTQFTPDGIAKLQEGLAAIRTRGDKVQPIAQVMLEAIAKIEAGQTTIDSRFNIPFLDHALKLSPGDLCVIAARPSLGKTALMNQLSIETAKRGVGVGQVHVEMTEMQMACRTMAYEYQASATKLMYADPAELASVASRFQKPEYPLNCVFDAYTPSEVYARVAELAAKGAKMVVVDHLHKLSLAGAKRDDLELGEVTGTLKNLAKRLGVCVVLLAQLNREVERRGEFKPSLADLRGSGNIEQDADWVVFIYGDKETTSRGIYIAKARNGKVCSFDDMLMFDGRSMRFMEKA